MKNHLKISLSLASLAILLLLSFSSYKLIPFGTPDGLDFHNVYAYSTCGKLLAEKFENNIYLASGSDCGDAMGRPFVYPPLLFYSLKWVSIFPTFEEARLVWRIFICTTLLTCIFLWSKSKRNFFISLPFFIALMFQFPALFALERGNNDIMVIIMWTLSAVFYRRKQFVLSGSFGALSVLMKVYPLFAFATITLGLILERKKEIFKKFYLGASLSGVVVFILYRNLWYSFLAKITAFANSRMVLDILNHSVQYITSNKVLNLAFFISLILIWSRTFKFDLSDKTYSFAGSLALCTYFSSTSFDYNLITVYPLAILLFAKFLNHKSMKIFYTLFLLVLGIAGNRSWFIFGGNLGFKVHILLQLAAIFIAALDPIPYPYIKRHLHFYFNSLKAKML